MAKVELKTKENDANVRAFIDQVEHETRRADSFKLLEMMQRLTDRPAVMWGSSIIGFGKYHYKYKSGREGEFFITGFSPRKTAMTVYIMPGYQDYSEMLDRLGKHKIGKSCLYINKLDDIDESVLEELITAGIAYMKANYQTE